MKKVVLLGLSIVAATAMTTAQAENPNGRERPAFSDIDTNGDGQITETEMAAFHAVKSAERFASMDTNSDGSLTAEEIIAATREGAQGRAQRRADRMLEKLDANENGTIEQDELQQVKGSGGRSGRMFARVDTDENGTISLEEYENMPTRGRRGDK